MGGADIEGAAAGDAQGLPPFRDPPPFTVQAAGQQLVFYPAGHDRLAALLELLGSARERIDMCFYIFAEDAVSAQVRDALAAAAARGVAVTLIIDRFGADATDAFLRPLAEAGGRYMCFNARWSQRYLIRNHQKIVIVDKARAMFGGFNIQNDYFAPPEENGWADLGIAIQGSAVAGLVHWFEGLARWTANPRPRYRDIRRAVRHFSWEEGGARWLVGGPARGLSTWAACVSRDLLKARRLDMFMAYFSPPRRLLKRIGQIAQRGEARLLLAAKSDNGATIGASRSLYRYLLQKGAKVWEFSPCKLHTKLIVLDDAVYMGSANFDMRSLYLNLEIMLKIEDAPLAARMREYITHYVQASQLVTPALHRKRATLFNRVRWKLGWLLVSVVDYTVSRRLNLGLSNRGGQS